MQSATAVAQDGGQQSGILPAEMAEVLTAVQASGDPRALEAVVLYLQRTHPEAQAAIAAWTARSQLADVLAGPVPAAQARAVDEAELLSGAVRPDDFLAMATRWSGEGELGAFMSTGSAPGSGFVGRVTLLAESSRWRIASSGRIDYQKTSGVVARNQIRLTFEPNYKFNARGYIFGLGQYEEDRFQGFMERYSLSAGLGYNLLDRDGRKLSIKAGPAMRVTQPVEGLRETALSAVALADLKLKLSRSLSYSQEVSTYFDATRQTFYTLAAIDSQLTGKLKARLSYTLQHETGEGIGGSLTDTTSRLTLVYGF